MDSNDIESQAGFSSFNRKERRNPFLLHTCNQGNRRKGLPFLALGHIC